MAEDLKCACGSDSVGIFPCSGASNVGQISNKVAVELTKQEIGKMMCTVGIGARISGLLKSAEGCGSVIAIDGCPLNCAKKTLELAGINIDRHIIIAEFAIDKNKNLDLVESELKEALDGVAAVLRS
ncbi:putative zinc-binding protein [Methanococcoides methylutens]|uniref:putative zinc-binding protein n=1 Tax=Methanococcoides methylutens TaxID=2226 RepID=UPI004044F12A